MEEVSVLLGSDDIGHLEIAKDCRIEKQPRNRRFARMNMDKVTGFSFSGMFGNFGISGIPDRSPMTLASFLSHAAAECGYSDSHSQFFLCLSFSKPLIIY
jgi:hypothetical protein